MRKGDEAVRKVHPFQGLIDRYGKPNQGEFLAVLDPISISFPNAQPSDGSTFPLLRLPILTNTIAPSRAPVPDRRDDASGEVRPNPTHLLGSRRRRRAF
jgi:hypothetical protein